MNSSGGQSVVQCRRQRLRVLKWPLTALVFAVALAFWLVSWRSYTTGAGQQQSYRFPDGSLMWLGESSNVRLFKKRYDSELRGAFYQGQVVFDFAPRHCPVRIVVDDSSLTFQGARLHMKRWENGMVWVQVMKGTVKLEGSDLGIPVVLRESDAITFGTAKDRSLKRGLNAGPGTQI